MADSPSGLNQLAGVNKLEGSQIGETSPTTPLLLEPKHVTATDEYALGSSDHLGLNLVFFSFE